MSSQLITSTTMDAWCDLLLFLFCIVIIKFGTSSRVRSHQTQNIINPAIELLSSQYTDLDPSTNTMIFTSLSKLVGVEVAGV
ncbi:hypothetical protein SADUNF_Sadunf09G0074300 [Salix dunnii]|uniref:Uncharacterized protein n=1 Tax=Salix dunnii TaxID=1413687 RepID=A0A835MR42_9ROSI|nr:hypothetical protein SADUNF_Sadunf09G0074300 [Salix dunnii]